MRARPSTGIVALSIYSTEPSQDFSRSKHAIDNARWLLQVLNEYRFPATWFMSDAVAQVVRKSILSAKLAHEFGMSIVASQSSSRSEFGRELDRQRLVAGSDGLKLTSLALSHGSTQQFDMLVRRGISALCPLELDSTSRSKQAIDWLKVESPHFGIWNLRFTLRIGDGGWLAQAVSRMNAKRQIHQAASDSKFCHIVVSLDQVGRGQIRRTLRAAVTLAAMLRDQGKLKTQTLTGVVDNLTARPATQRAKSILRVA
jgi:hypothetical protein